MPDLLFTVSNRHTAACAPPPRVDGDEQGAYYGYFSNEHGEQAVYVYDWHLGEATVRMGDAGWDRMGQHLPCRRWQHRGRNRERGGGDVDPRVLAGDRRAQGSRALEGRTTARGVKI